MIERFKRVVLDDVTTAMLKERVRCLRIVEQAIKRFPDQPQLRCVLACIAEEIRQEE